MGANSSISVPLIPWTKRREKKIGLFSSGLVRTQRTENIASWGVMQYRRADSVEAPLINIAFLGRLE